MFHVSLLKKEKYKGKRNKGKEVKSKIER